MSEKQITEREFLGVKTKKVVGGKQAGKYSSKIHLLLHGPYILLSHQYAFSQCSL